MLHLLSATASIKIFCVICYVLGRNKFVFIQLLYMLSLLSISFDICGKEMPINILLDYLRLALRLRLPKPACHTAKCSFLLEATHKIRGLFFFQCQRWHKSLNTKHSVYNWNHNPSFVRFLE